MKLWLQHCPASLDIPHHSYLGQCQVKLCLRCCPVLSVAIPVLGQWPMLGGIMAPALPNLSQYQNTLGSKVNTQYNLNHRIVLLAPISTAPCPQNYLLSPDTEAQVLWSTTGVTMPSPLPISSISSIATSLRIPGQIAASNHYHHIGPPFVSPHHTQWYASHKVWKQGIFTNDLMQSVYCVKLYY